MTVQPQEQMSPVQEGPVVSRVDWAPVPRVNLLPPEVLQARRFRVVRWRLMLAGAATLALVAGAVYWAQSGVGAAQDELAITQAQTTLLHRQEAKYATVPALLSQLDAARSARQVALGQDVLWYRFLNDVALATPANVSLTTLSATLTATSGAAAAPSSGSDPLVPAGIGSVTVTGTAAGYPDVAAWLQSIAAVKGLDASTLQNATRGAASSGGSTSAAPGAVTFTTTVVVTAAALSHRYDQKAG